MDFFCVSPAHEWAACEMGECIGMESCVDLQENQEAALGGCGGGRRRCVRLGSEVMKRIDFPPPLPTLARTENLSSSHMQWAMRRYYTGDGRLVIREEKIRHREYFLQAHRSGGRLTLQFVPLGDEEDDDVDEEEEEEEREYNNNNAEADPYDHHQFGDDEMRGSDRVAAGGGGGGNWYGHASVRSKPCMLGMDVPAAIMPVHT
ncbi:uncharacterized protein LOC127808485 [Diospyros lotus]|uniref:uncharacterized protein LOC127808485 n=1 Tax=Diospyros lotus TaxID=55363 RepID=UPI002253DFF7|nr:uncharacterized protein LOC127808485 [Diospyros lotus]